MCRDRLKGAMYSLVEPTRVAKPSLIAFSRECAKLLGLSEEEVCAP